MNYVAFDPSIVALDCGDIRRSWDDLHRTIPAWRRAVVERWFECLVSHEAINILCEEGAWPQWGDRRSYTALRSCKEVVTMLNEIESRLIPLPSWANPDNHPVGPVTTAPDFRDFQVLPVLTEDMTRTMALLFIAKTNQHRDTPVSLAVRVAASNEITIRQLGDNGAGVVVPVYDSPAAIQRDAENQTSLSGGRFLIIGSSTHSRGYVEVLMSRGAIAEFRDRENLRAVRAAVGGTYHAILEVTRGTAHEIEFIIEKHKRSTTEHMRFGAPGVTAFERAVAERVIPWYRERC